MEIYADFRQKVKINPKDVIEKLIEKEIGTHSWIFEKDGKFYVGFYEIAGGHSFEQQEEIQKEQYEYIKSLQFILKKQMG